MIEQIVAQNLNVNVDYNFDENVNNVFVNMIN